MKKCEECNLSFENTKYYEHNLIDHNLTFCIYCSTKLRPHNFHQHIFTIHGTDWKDIEFTQQFVRYYGDSLEVLTLVHELEYFIPLSIIKNIKEVLSALPNRSSEDVLLLELELAQTQFRLGEILSNIISVTNELYIKIFDSGSLLLRTKFILFGFEINTNTSFNEFMVQEFKKLLEHLNTINLVDLKLEMLAKAISISLQEKNTHTAKSFLETTRALIANNQFIGKDRNLFEFKIVEQLINENSVELYKLIVDYIDKNQDYPIRIAQAKVSTAIMHLNNKEYTKSINDIHLAMKLFKEQEYNIKFIDASQILTNIYILDKKYPEAYDNIRKTRNFLEDLVGLNNIGVLKYHLPILNDLLNSLLSNDNYSKNYDEIHSLRVKIDSIIGDIEDDLDFFYNDLQIDKELLQTLIEFKESFTEYCQKLRQLENQA